MTNNLDKMGTMADIVDIVGIEGIEDIEAFCCFGKHCTKSNQLQLPKVQQ